MNKKYKLLFKILVGLNLLLIAFLFLGTIKINHVKNQIMITEVQHRLVELEGLIANESDNHWSEPNIVTTQLGKVLNGIWLSNTIGKQIGMLSKDDSDILINLFYKLNQYPQDELYKLIDLSDQDIENFEELREKLHNAGLGMNLEVSGDIEEFMNQAAKLEKSIQLPLN